MDLARQSEGVKNSKRRRMTRRSTLNSSRLKTKRIARMRKKSMIRRMMKKMMRMLTMTEMRWTRLMRTTSSATSET